jgi:hypothetical protein
MSTNRGPFTLIAIALLGLSACSKLPSASAKSTSGQSVAAKKLWTRDELKKAVHGLSKAELKDLLGPPDSASDRNWWYNTLPMFDPITEKKVGKVCIVVGEGGSAYLWDVWF